MATASKATTTLLLAGDVMTGRAVDQVMRSPLSPELYESWIRDARDYVRLAERAHGPVPAPVGPGYVWGDALTEIERRAPAVRIVNLETAVTTSATPAPRKGIHYRMNPAHVDCLTAARLDACTLANNHVMDWGLAGLAETIATLEHAGVRPVGAGTDLAQAEAPVALAAGPGRVVVYGRCTESSGVPATWAAGPRRAGVALLPDLDDAVAARLAERIARERRPGDLVVVSLHWGENRVHRVPDAHRRFARRLLEAGGVDIVHGHSSHHPLAAEVVAGKLAIYGCGDLVNDYEGIEPLDAQADVGCLWFPTLDASTGALVALRIVPLRRRRLRLEPLAAEERRELARRLDDFGAPLGTRVVDAADGGWLLRWPQ